MNTSKIIKGVVGNGRYTVTAPIVKENYGIYLQIEGAELPETYQVDFSNDEHHGTSVTMIGNADGVKIPRQFIDTGKDVFAFLYHVGANYGKTVYKFRIPNKCRPDRTSEQPTPEEQSTINQCISALNNAVAQTAQDVIDADASERMALGYAESAQESARQAQEYSTVAISNANSASRSASQASASATASAQSASASAQIKADVEDLVDDAQGYANASAQSASQASASEQGCARAVLDAASAAAIARARADEASGYAQTASSKASEASQSASTASAKATESAQSATNANQSAQTAEQAKTASQTAQGLAESARDSAISAKNDAESARDEAQNIVDGISAKAEQIDANTASVASLEEDRYKPYVVDSASGSIASFSDGADDIPLKSLIVDINPIQDLSHGDPSPENLCPISGWTGANVNVNGTVITISWETEAGTVYGGKLDVLSGKLYIGYGICKVKDLSWSLFNTVFYATKADVKHGIAKVDIRCDRYKTALSASGLGSASSWLDNVILGNSSTSSVIYIKDTAYASATEFKTAQGEMDIVYPLATPIEIQLTPHEVNSLLGQNNIFADTGDTSAEYRADTKLYISKRIAEAISALS